MKIGIGLALAAAATVVVWAADGSRPKGPCDIYGSAGTPCVAAHSTTRALYASYSGPLYRVKRPSDGRTLDIGVAADGGHANAAAQDRFCAGTLCVIDRIYDQSGKGNHLLQAPPGPLFPGPDKGAFDTQPLADMAPVTIGGHKVYGVYILPGMGLRNNDAKGLAVGDEPEGIYYVVEGTHFDSGCCFDYGNASTNGRAVGTGTMETTYFGTSTNWGRGDGAGPWIMADMEAGLFSGYDAKLNAADPTIDSWRFVTAVVNGGGGNRWELRGGNAQAGMLNTFYRGVRPGSRTNSDYFPMHKQGAVLLGTGGDNGNGSSGTFYEGVMVAGYPTEAATDAVQANIVAAKYDVARVSLSRVTTFTPESTQTVTVQFTNTTGAPAEAVRMSVGAPKGWRVTAGSNAMAGTVAPGASVSAMFEVTSPASAGSGYLTGKVEWKHGAGGMQAESREARIRNVPAVKINEVGLGGGDASTDQFVELYNASRRTVDLSNWSVVHRVSQWAPVKLASIPAGTKLEPGGFYLLGVADSGLAAPANAGSTVVNVRSVWGFEAGQPIEIDGERRTVVSVGTTATAPTTVFIPVSTVPWLTVPAGSTSLPVTNGSGFAVGQKIGIDLGGNYETATVTAVGQQATQTTIAAPAAAGSTNLRLGFLSNLTPGDTLTVGTGEHKEQVRVKSVGTERATGTGVELTAPLRFEHGVGIDVSDPGTGIRFTPATKFGHVSGDAVQALGSGITLDRPLEKAHAHGAPVTGAKRTKEGYQSGYQGPLAPNQWFGSVLSTRVGSLALLDGNGTLVDGIVYGSQQSNSSANGTVASPEIATLEGDQGQGGCIAVLPGPAGIANRSLGRYPDGADTDSLCTDFFRQTATTLPIGAAAGATNLKVASVSGLAAGQTVLVDTGADQEKVVIATVGSAGATTVQLAEGAEARAGAKVIPVLEVIGFSAGQTITIDEGEKEETVVVSAVTRGRRGVRITLAAPLRMGHSPGAPVAGSGITVTTGLTRSHMHGTAVTDHTPTPGAPNQYGPCGR